MKRKEKLKSGISLIVLVITIIVIIILATAIIVSIAKNNPIEEANKARYESDKDNMQSILTMTVAKIATEKRGNVILTEGLIVDGKIGYTVENAVDGNNSSGNIFFDDKKNNGNDYYIGKKLPKYNSGETNWYVNKQGDISVKVGKKVYGKDSENFPKAEDEMPSISNSTNCIGKFADIEGDGKIDGIIFVDLAIGNTGAVSEENSKWIKYNITKQTDDLKEYYVRETKSDSRWDNIKREVVVPKTKITGNDRFYIMSLEDFNSSVYCWYNSAFKSEMTDWEKTTSTKFGQGIKNTENIIAKWDNNLYGNKNTNSSCNDVWSVIKAKVSEGWFIPSQEEWSAFATELNISKHNSNEKFYMNYNLKNWYWTSSQANTKEVWSTYFNGAYFGTERVYGKNYVRLARMY